MEILFPNIVGYRCQNEEDEISCNYDNLPQFRLDFNDVPSQTILSSAVGGGEVILKSDYRELRDAQVIYELTRWLINLKYTDSESGRQFQKFAQLKRVVTQWYNQQVEIVGGDGSKELRRLVVFWQQSEVVASIYEGIRAAAKSGETISAILNYYNPEGSSRYVHGVTTKAVYPTTKSHINYVVADTDSWEQIAAKTLEQNPQVKCYVKNHFLGFAIPYLEGTTEHNYIPDFIAKVKTNQGESVNLIIEISGFSADRNANKDIKRYYTNDYWIPAANNLRIYGRWDFVEVSDIDNIRAILNREISKL